MVPAPSSAKPRARAGAVRRALPHRLASTRNAAATMAEGLIIVWLAEADAADVEMGDVAAGPDCVICMNPVACRDVNERMVTPCNHFFHTKCLVRWMDIKQECPTCRRHLPPM